MSGDYVGLKKLLRIVVSIIIILSFDVLEILAKGLQIKEEIISTMTGERISTTREILINEENVLLKDSILQYRALFKINNNRIYLIDDKNKRYSIAKINEESILTSHEFYDSITFLNDNNIISRDSGNKKTIGKYNCFEIVVYMPEIAALTSLWLTQDVSKPLEMYYAFLEKRDLGIPMKKLIQILKTYNAGAVEIITTVIRPNEKEKYLIVKLDEILYKDIPVVKFSIPEGYRLANEKPE